MKKAIVGIVTGLIMAIVGQEASGQIYDVEYGIHVDGDDYKVSIKGQKNISLDKSRYNMMYMIPADGVTDYILGLNGEIALKDVNGNMLPWHKAQPVFSSALSVLDGIYHPWALPAERQTEQVTPDGIKLVRPYMGWMDEIVQIDEDKYTRQRRYDVYTGFLINIFSQIDLQAMLASNEHEDMSFDAAHATVDAMSRSVSHQKKIFEKLAAIAKESGNLKLEKRYSTYATRLGKVTVTAGGVLAGLQGFGEAEQRRMYINRAMRVPMAELRMAYLLEHIEESEDKLDPVLVLAAKSAYDYVSGSNHKMIDSIKEGVAKGTFKLAPSAIALLFNEALKVAVASSALSKGTLAAAKLASLKVPAVGVVAFSVVGIIELGFDFSQQNNDTVDFTILWIAVSQIYDIMRNVENNPQEYQLSTGARGIMPALNNSMRLYTTRWAKRTYIDGGQQFWKFRGWWKDLRDQLNRDMAILQVRELAHYRFFENLDKHLNAVKRLYSAPESSQVSLPVCDRTPQVRDAIIAMIGELSCSNFTSDNLAMITRLNMSNNGALKLKAGDFDGLTRLAMLFLNNNRRDMNSRITSLPLDIFDGLTELEGIELGFNNLTTLPAGIFDGLTNLKAIQLGVNNLTTLPEGAFDGLADLHFLSLMNNNLTTLPAGIFDDLTGLERLYLNGNNLTCLPRIPSSVTVLSLPFGRTRSSYPQCR